MGKHYKNYENSRKNKIIRESLKLIVLFILVISIYKTYSKYASFMNTQTTLQVARWSIFINGEQISNDTERIHQPAQLISSSGKTTNIDQGDECYFDIILNPISTETALKFSISIDLLSQSTTLPEGTIIEKYERYSGNAETPDSTTYVTENNTYLTVTEDINLNNTALDSSAIRKYRIYFIIPEHLNVSEGQEYIVVPTIYIQQKIGNN